MDTNNLLKVLKATSDEKRLRIIKILLDGETCACELLEQLNVTQPTLSHHMKILTDSGLVHMRKDAQWARYSIDASVVMDARDFFDDIIKTLSRSKMIEIE